MRRRIHRSSNLPLVPRIKEPINVFVSSHQQEFAETRRRIKSRIQKVRIKQFRRRLFEAELVEDYPGPDLKATINKLLSRGSILVLLIGRNRSDEWVDYELDYAKRNDIPILAYEYYREIANPPPVETAALVEKLKGRTMLHGHGDKKYGAEEDLLKAIPRDLVEEVGIMINGYTNVKREINASYERQKESIRRGWLSSSETWATGAVM